MILDFNCSVEDCSPDIVGGKFAHLHRLAGINGLTVPPAICLTDLNYDKAELLSRLDSSKLYAVRSSSPFEDRPGMTAAGIFESYLNIPFGDEIHQNIKRCFDSVKSTRAEDYFQNLGISSSEIKMAVIVQEMVEAEKSGVTFTCHPLTGEDLLYIQVVDGLGENLVSGKVVPKTYTLLFEETTSDPLLAAIRNAGSVVRNRFDDPQDIEWAWQNNTLYVLQSRPVQMNKKQTYEPSEYWTRANIGEIIPKPLTPLSWSVFKQIVFYSYRIKYYSLFERFFMNLVHLIPRKPPKVISPKPFSGYLYLNLETIMNNFGGEPWVNKKTLELGLGFLYPDSVLNYKSFFRDKIVTWLKGIIFFAEFIFPCISMERKVVKFVEKRLTIFKNNTSIDELNRLIGICRFLFGWHIAVTARSFTYLGFSLFLSRFIKRYSFESIIASLSQTKEEGYSQSLRKLKRVMADGSNMEQLDRVAESPEYQNFLNKFGHRSLNEFELMQPAWGEDRRELLKLVLELNMEIDTAGKDIELPWIYRLLATRMSKAIRNREELKSLLIKHYKELRIYYLNLASKLSYLNDPEDIFFLDSTEISLEQGDIPILKSKIQERKDQYLQNYRNHPAYSFLQGSIANVHSGEIKNQLTGISCAPGIRKGRALVIRDIANITQINHDDIIITHSAEPGWTPYLLKSAGLAAEVGGVLSHLATIARENRIPMIVGIPNLLESIEDGQSLSIDGNHGEIIKI